MQFYAYCLSTLNSIFVFTGWIYDPGLYKCFYKNSRQADKWGKKGTGFKHDPGQIHTRGHHELTRVPQATIVHYLDTINSDETLPCPIAPVRGDALAK